MSFTIRSSSFAHEGAIPSVYTCDGRDISPHLAWSGAPEGTQSFVLIVDDPDAPDPRRPRRTWVHWVLYNIPAGVTEIPEGEDIPAFAHRGLNDWRRPGYGGPCPPIGRHRYFHKLYALDTVLPDLGRASKAAVEKAMRGHVLASTAIIGTYEKR